MVAVHQGWLTTLYTQFLKLKEYSVVSSSPLSPGKRKLSIHFRPKEKSLKPDFFTGDVTLFLDGELVGVAKDIKIAGQYSAVTCYGLLNGRNTGTPVSYLYEPPYKFTGEIEKVTIKVAPTQSTQKSKE